MLSIFQVSFFCFIIMHAFVMIVLFKQSGCILRAMFFGLTSDSEVNQSDADFSYIRNGEFKLRYEEMERNFKVFVYPKENFHTPSEFTGPYASEAFFFKNLEESQLRTDNAEDANMFFIPISVQEMSSKRFTLYRMRNYIMRCIQTISSEFPYWNRSFGLDHFFVSCHEMGLNVTQAVPLLVKNAIRVVCFPKINEGYVKGKDLTLPQVLLPFIDQAAGTNTKMRTRLGLLAGMINRKVNRDYFNIMNSTPLKGAKENALWTPDYYTAKFCMCPGESQVDNARIADAIHYGCVPVIWPDHYDLPFSELLWWNLFSRKIEKYDVYYPNHFLKKISDAEYRALQNFTVKVQMHFQWNSPPTRYDAFHFIMLQLFERYLKRSHVFQLTKELAKHQTTAIVTMGEEDSEIQKRIYTGSY